MDYNTEREKLMMPEYGRGIQNMVDYATSLENRDERNRCARTIVAIMGNMFPHLRDVPDFKHKLWDHLAIMSNFKLDIDYPYEVTTARKLQEKPEPLSYPMHRIRYRHYGYLVEETLKALETMPDGEERGRLIQMVADQMKRDLFNWNKDAMDEEKVVADVANYTHGAVQIDLDTMRLTDCKGAGNDNGNGKGKGGGRQGQNRGGGKRQRKRF